MTKELLDDNVFEIWWHPNYLYIFHTALIKSSKESFLSGQNKAMVVIIRLFVSLTRHH